MSYRSTTTSPKRRSVSRAALGTILTTATFIACAGVAGASTFAGRCQFTGNFSYSHPVGFLPTAVRWSDSGAGSCSGTLDGAAATVPAAITERLQDDIGGCGPTSDAHGTGTIILSSRQRIAYHTEHPLVLGAPFVVHDDHGGVAVGALTAYLHGSLPILQQCLDSTFTTGQFDLILQTITPLRADQQHRAEPQRTHRA